MRYFISCLLIFVSVLACKKSTLETSTDTSSIIKPTVSINGLDSLRIGDSTNLNFTFSGTPPFKLVYTDGSTNISVENITSTSYAVYVKPIKTTTYKAVSISDKNTTGTVSGEFNVWVQPQFVSKTANYTSINLTVGNINNNKYFRGNYYTLDDINSMFSFKMNDGNTYQMSDHSYAFFDFNNDGYLDLFGWLYNLTPVMGRNPGKYILIDNVLSTRRKISFFASDISWPSGLELNDFNNDGIKDFVFYSYNNHVDLGGASNNSSKPVKVFLFNKNGTFKEIDATNPLIVHDMSSGDLNNDGSSDLLVWEYDQISKPRIYLNNGSGSFIETPVSNMNGLLEILNTHTGGYASLANELFDINGDGNLDIITSSEIGGKSWDYTYHNESIGYKLTQQRIYWGSGNGKFDFNQNYSDLPNNSIPIWSRTQPGANDSVKIFNQNSKIALGFNFIDFNNDGKMDILTAITPNYKGYILQLHQNLGNNTFKDVTIENINNYNGLLNGPNNNGVNGDFPNFYEIRPYDIDGDGDLDLVPHGVACWNPYTYPKNLFWENNGGKFVLRK